MRCHRIPSPGKKPELIHTKSIQYIVTGLMFLSPLLSQSTYGEDRFPKKETFVLKTGLYRVSSMSTELRVDQPGGAVGTSVGLEKTLKMPESVDVQRLDGYYRFNNKQRIDFSYYNVERSGTVNLTSPVIIGDITIPVGQTTSSAKSQVLKGVWSYSFINNDDYEFGLGAGLHITANKTTVTDDDVPTTTTTENITLPLPVISFRGDWKITRKLLLGGRQDIFLVDIGESRGTMIDLNLRLEHQTFKHFGFGAELSYLGSNMQSKSGGLNAEVNRRYRGTMLYMKGVL